jgi:hypothetical protein
MNLVNQLTSAAPVIGVGLTRFGLSEAVRA